VREPRGDGNVGLTLFRAGGGGARRGVGKVKPERAGRTRGLPRSGGAGYVRPMPTVGEQLRGARERLRLEVREVADATNIKSDHLRALEDERWEAFSAPVYIKGFVRTYAQHLRLDVPQLLAELDATLARTADFAEPPSLTGRRRGPLDYLMLQFSRLRWAIVLPVLVGIAVVAATLYGFSARRLLLPRAPARPLGGSLHQGRRPAVPATLPLPTNAAPGNARPR
jgi:hypothetical protein